VTVRELDDVVLPGGRRLALCEVGDPSGRVAFYFHGTGSSRLETGLYASAAAAAGVRLVGWGLPAGRVRRARRRVTGDGDPFRPFAERLEAAGATLHVFPGGHVSGFVPEVIRQVMALL
jgi:hypothetical protein